MVEARHIIGIDVGGTFTDAVVLDASGERLLAAFKLPSTPDDPGRAVVEAVDRIGRTHDVSGALVCHGTTVGTNTLIERKGARTALVTTQGFADVIALRRQARPRLYDLSIDICEPLVESEARLELPERMAADGSVVAPVGDLSDLIAGIAESGATAVAVSFLNAYANPAHEETVVAALEVALPDVYVTRSTEICPEFREYERTSTAVVNAYIGPVVQRYMLRLDGALAKRGIDRLMVVKSNGGLTSPVNAGRFPVHLIESGPAAGLAAAAAFAKATGRPNLIAFDMGGTTAKVGLIRDGEPETSAEFYADRFVDGKDVGGYAIRSPILDLVEIGAGGGSIAVIDEAGVLKVGPRSAGADPGPACYGRGGELPTVTDAHAVIGTLSARLFEGSGVAFDAAKAEDAIRRHVAEPYGWSLARAAYAIVDIAVANMAEMVRLATVQRGIDPRGFAMLASGGAGPLHAPLVAREIGIPELIVPLYPGMFSALGATLGEIRHEVVQSLLVEVGALGADTLVSAFTVLRERAHALLANEPARIGAPTFERYVDARFVGQMFELKLPFREEQIDPEAIEENFRRTYAQEYGFDLPSAKVQVVGLRLVATQTLGIRADALLADRDRGQKAARPGARVPLLDRDGVRLDVPYVLAAESGGVSVTGPAVISHQGSTVWLVGGQVAHVADDGRLLVTTGGRA